MSYRFADSLRAGSGRSSVNKLVWHITLLCVQRKTRDDGQRNCPKHVECYSKTKLETFSASNWFYYKKLQRCYKMPVTFLQLARKLLQFLLCVLLVLLLHLKMC